MRIMWLRFWRSCDIAGGPAGAGLDGRSGHRLHRGALIIRMAMTSTRRHVLTDAGYALADFAHDHDHDHDHGDHDHDHVHVMDLPEGGRTVELQQKVLAKNDDLAERNRRVAA